MPSSNDTTRRFGDLAPSDYPGERLGLPASGAGSVARFGRRLVALLLDWGIATVIVTGVAALMTDADLTANPYLVPAVFAVLQIVFIPTIGGSVGHRVLGMRVVPIGGGYVGLWRPLVRTVLLCLVVPIVVWDSDQRGFHDKIAGTVLIRG